MLHATGRGIARLPNAALPVQSYLPQPLPDLVQLQRWLFARIIHQYRLRGWKSATAAEFAPRVVNTGCRRNAGQSTRPLNDNAQMKSGCHALS